MKKEILGILKLLGIGAIFFSFSGFYPQSDAYKCLIQLINYTGEGAYVTVSLMDDAGMYKKTLSVLGDDETWYPDLRKWWNGSPESVEELDAVTGASITNGGRKVAVLNIDPTWKEQGYALRFETAVEDKKYYETDIVIPLDTALLGSKIDGTGYIRYAKLLANSK